MSISCFCHDIPSGKGDGWKHQKMVVGVTEVVGIKRGGLTKQKKSYKRLYKKIKKKKSYKTMIND